MNEAEYYISNHYFCQKCYDNRFIYRYYKNINSEWVECSKNEAKIGMQYCPRCNCEERVHESAFLDPKYEDGKRPSRIIFWDFRNEEELSSKISLNLYKQIFKEHRG